MKTCFTCKVLRPLSMLLAFIVCVIAISIALVWESDRSVESLTARWAPPPSRFILLDGLSAHVRDEGARDDPRPIVLLHGTSASLHTWDGWTAELVKSRRVIRVDLPGFGLTGPAPENDYRIQRYVRFVTALYDHFQITQSVLAGNSLGGGIAWQCALALPQRVSQLILVDAAGYPMTSQSIPIAFRLARIPAIAPVVINVLPRGLVEASVKSVYGDPNKVTPELVDRYFELALRTGNRAALMERFRQTVWGEGRERIQRISQPTLILWGGKDRLIPSENGARFKRDIAGSELVEFDALGHVPHEEDPRATLVPVRRFLGATGA